MKRLISAILIYLLSTQVLWAQWQVPTDSIPIGRGSGSGFKSLLPRVTTFGFVQKTDVGTSAATECGKLTELGGNKFYLFSPGAAASVVVGCAITYINTDTTHTKRISASGLSNKSVFPGQTIQYTSDGTNWYVTVDPGPYAPTATPVFYVSPAAAGNSDNPDVADCFSTDNACNSIQKGADHCSAIDGSRLPIVWTPGPNYGLRNGCTVQLANAIGGSPHSITTPVYVDGSTSNTPITFRGDPTTPSNVNVRCDNQFQGITSQNGALVIVDGVNVFANGVSNCTFLNTLSKGTLIVRNVHCADSGTEVATSCAGAANDSTIMFDGTFQVGAAGVTMISAVQGLDHAILTFTGNIVIPGAMTFTSAFIVGQDHVIINSEGNAFSVSGAGVAGTTGFKYLMTEFSNMTVNNPSALPGADFRLYNGSVVNSNTGNFGTGNTQCTTGEWCYNNTIAAGDNSTQLPNTAWVQSELSTLISSGSWTPVLRGASTAGSNTYAAQVGHWNKVGDGIRLTFFIQTSALSGMVGTAQISGFPNANTATANDLGACAIGYYQGVTFSAGRTQLGGKISANAAIIDVMESGSGVSGQGVPVTNLAAATILSGTCNYHN